MVLDACQTTDHSDEPGRTANPKFTPKPSPVSAEPFGPRKIEAQPYDANFFSGRYRVNISEVVSSLRTDGDNAVSYTRELPLDGGKAAGHQWIEIAAKDMTVECMDESRPRANKAGECRDSP